MTMTFAMPTNSAKETLWCQTTEKHSSIEIRQKKDAAISANGLKKSSSQGRERAGLSAFYYLKSFTTACILH